MHDRVKGLTTLSEALQKELPNVFGDVAEKYEKKKLDAVLLPIEIFLRGLETHFLKKFLLFN